MFPTLTGEAVLFKIIEALFTFAGGLTCAYMIKLFIAVFVEKNTDPTLQAKYDAKKKYMNWMTAACLIIPAAVLPVLGIIPGFTMDEIAGVSQSFLHGHDPAHAVAYFSWTNLKGAVASISIGIILYFLIVRMCLIQKNAEGRSVYLNAWPKWLNIEEKVYRPALLQVFPFIGAFAARTVASVVDVTIAGAQRVLFYDRKERFSPPLDPDFATYSQPRNEG